MPLVYDQASKRRNMIATDTLLAELETSGFVKCVARKTCLDNLPKEQQLTVLRESLRKQFNDWNAPDTPLSCLDELEALVDIRNVVGLLFLALK